MVKIKDVRRIDKETLNKLSKEELIDLIDDYMTYLEDSFVYCVDCKDTLRHKQSKKWTFDPDYDLWQGKSIAMRNVIIDFQRILLGELVYPPKTESEEEE